MRKANNNLFGLKLFYVLILHFFNFPNLENSETKQKIFSPLIY